MLSIECGMIKCCRLPTLFTNYIRHNFVFVLSWYYMYTSTLCTLCVQCKGKHDNILLINLCSHKPTYTCYLWNLWKVQLSVKLLEKLTVVLENCFQFIYLQHIVMLFTILALRCNRVGQAQLHKHAHCTHVSMMIYHQL